MSLKKPGIPKPNWRRYASVVMYKKSSLPRNRVLFYLLVLIPDAISIFIAGLVAVQLRFDDVAQLTGVGGIDFNYQYVVAFISIGWLILLILTRTYQYSHSAFLLLHQQGKIKKSLFFFFGVGFFSFIFKVEFSRSIFVTMLCLGIVLMTVNRVLFHFLLIRNLMKKRIISTELILIGLNSNLLSNYKNWIVSNRNLGYRIKKVISTRVIDLSLIETLESEFKRDNSLEVLLLPGLEVDRNFAKFINFLEDLKIHVNWVPLDSGSIGYWRLPTEQTGVPFLTFESTNLNLLQVFAKRCFDICFSICILIFLSPIFAIVAGLIFIFDGWPIFFTQKRVGRGGTIFSVFKFRTMIKDAEFLIDSNRNIHSNSHVLFKDREDPRITNLGRILRRFSIDELPQFLNVLNGDMSVVGPRPALPNEVKKYDSLYERRLIAKPGITGPWQISGRSDLDKQTSMALDLNYLLNWSFQRDIWYVIATIGSVFKGKGAY